jgi:hypothetical protein
MSEGACLKKAIRHQMRASYQHGMLGMYRYGHAVA